MEKKYIVALDQGTRSSRAVIFNKKEKNLWTTQNTSSTYPIPTGF